MKAHVLDDAQRLRAHLARSREVYGPAVEAGVTHWTRVEDDRLLDLAPTASLPQFSPKQFFFADREPLFVFDGSRFVETRPQPGPRVLFGLRACDATAVAYQDRFFAEDPHYRARRDATLLVALDCASPCSHGFCPTTDSGPAVGPGCADLVLSRDAADEPWTLIVASARGASALEGLELAAAPDDWQARRGARRQRAVEGFASDDRLRAGIARVRAGAVEAESWEQLGARCLACSGCTILCPTCSCFTTVDSEVEAGIERSRVWDSCLYDGFQREASGHHPSASAGSRVERFWRHKFGAEFAEMFGRDGCVGCGRCDQTCPGAIGARSVLNGLAGP